MLGFGLQNPNLVQTLDMLSKPGMADIKIKQFAFPWLLTTLHTSCAFVGCYMLMLRGHFKITRLTTSENLVMIAFSFLFTINIAISNLSL